MNDRKDSFVINFSFEGKRYQARGKTEAEAEVKKAMKLRDLQEGKVALEKNTPVKVWAEICINTYKSNQKEITSQNYKYRVNHYILDHIGNIPLGQVKPLHCQAVLNKLNGKSKYLIDQTYYALRFIFRTAVENQLIVSNPTVGLVRPDGTKSTRRSITEYEREGFLKVCNNERFILFELMLYCGCRPSEAIEAMGRDIINEGGENLLHIRGTKTDKSDRLVPIPNDLYKKIKKTPKFGYICPNTAGKRIDRSSYIRLKNSLYREMNIALGCKVYRNELIPPYPLAKDFVPYCFRHTFCTDLQKKDIDIRTAQYLMGHADIQMTANIYTHTDINIIIDAAKKINAK